jgi:hypothetical protein
MANNNAPFGMRPVGRLGSAPMTQGTSKYKIADGYGTAIFKGDIMILLLKSQRSQIITLVVLHHPAVILRHLSMMIQTCFSKFKTMEL